LIEFTASTYFTGPAVTDDLIAAAERKLGYELPRSYVELLRIRNGGEPVRHCYPVEFANSWAEGHIDVGAILGVGGSRGIDAEPFGSPYMVKQWGYPPIGIVICDTPSGGHDTVMLDYSRGGEPSVVYLDEDRVPRQVAATFADFLMNLIECPHVTLRVAD
jgi:hypothetical protein